tara:strand:+ start:11825 stop:12364 length:540 start_codon:yes stop_codon:yes gene_type:complete
MPLYNYTCTDGHSFEELVPQGYTDVMSCEYDECTCIANRQTVYVVATIGPVSSGLEEFNKTLLTPKQRAAGIELKTKSQVEAYEQMKGYRRVDPNSISARANISDCLDDHNDISKIQSADGKEAAADYVYKTEMQKSTGWGDAKYSNWKRGHDAAVSAARDGRVGLESVDRRPDQKPTD